MNQKISIDRTSAYSWHKSSRTGMASFRLVQPNRDRSPTNGGRFESLRRELLAPVLDDAKDPELCRRLRLAANEAAALAWTTPYPLLMFPCLFEEKTQAVREQFKRQEQIRASSKVWLTLPMPLAWREIAAPAVP